MERSGGYGILNICKMGNKQGIRRESVITPGNGADTGECSETATTTTQTLRSNKERKVMHASSFTVTPVKVCHDLTGGEPKGLNTQVTRRD